MSASPIVVPAGVLLSATHVAAVRVVRASADDLGHVRVLCFVAGEAEGRLAYDGAVPDFDVVAARIADTLAAVGSDTVETMDLFDRLITHQACRAAVEADVTAMLADAPLATPTADFVDAYRRCWSDDLVRNLELLGTDGIAGVLERLDEEIDTLGPNIREAAALRGLLNDWRDEWRGLGAPPEIP